MNVGMFGDVNSRNYRVRAMGGEKSWCFLHRRNVGSSKGKHGPKARCHLMELHVYSHAVVPITDLHSLFFPLSAGAAKSSCIHPAS